MTSPVTGVVVSLPPMPQWSDWIRSVHDSDGRLVMDSVQPVLIRSCLKDSATNRAPCSFAHRRENSSSPLSNTYTSHPALDLESSRSSHDWMLGPWYSRHTCSPGFGGRGGAEPQVGESKGVSIIALIE